ncbi:MAG: zinc-dependent metalloprotease, partial [Planctomycetota bacterium]
MQMRTAALARRLREGSLAGVDAAKEASSIDGVPEAYLGGILREIVMHEVGHTLGLRHNFKASTWLSLDEYVHRRGEANVGSVMDYNPIYVPPDP